MNECLPDDEEKKPLKPAPDKRAALLEYLRRVKSTMGAGTPVIKR